MNRVTICTTPILVLSLLFFCGSAVGAKKSANIAAFADQTIALMSNPDSGFNIDETLLIRKYLRPEDPDYAVLLSISQKVLRLLISLTDYSIEIATLASVGKTDAQQVTDYANYLSLLQEEVVEVLAVPDEKFSEVIAQIRKQKNLLDAVRTAQPIINALSRYGQLMLNDYDESISIVAANLDSAIEQNFSVLVEFSDILDRRRSSVLAEIAVLEASVTTNKDYRDDLLERVDRVQDIAAIVRPQLELYWDTHRELDAIHLATTHGSAQVRLILLVWSRAHAAMASGKKISTDWVDEYKDLGAAAYKLGRSLND